MCWYSWAATTSTSSGWTTCRSSSWARRRSTTRTGTTRSASSACGSCPSQGDEDLSSHILRGGLDAGFDLAFSNELRIDHSVTCPIITLRPECDLPIVPIYTNIFAAAAAAQAPRPARPDDPRASSSPGQPTSGWRSSAPGTCRWSWAAPGSSARTAPTPSSTARRWSGSRQVTWRGARRGVARVPVGAGQRHPRLPRLHADDRRRRGGEQAATWAPWTCSPPMEAYFTWYPQRARRRLMSQVPAGQIPLHHRPGPRAGRAVPRVPAGAPSSGGRPSGPTSSSTCPTGEQSSLAHVRRRRAGGAGHETATEAVRARRAPVPDADPVHRHVRTVLSRNVRKAA